MVTNNSGDSLRRLLVEPDGSNGPGDTSLLFDIWGLLRRRWRLIVAGSVAGVVIAVLFYVVMPPTYESTVQIVVTQKDANLPAQAMERERAEESSTFNDLLATHVQIFRSPRIIQQAITNHQLDRLPTFVAQSEKSETFDPVLYISRRLRVYKGGDAAEKDARVLRAGFRGPSREDCLAVLDALVESYQRFLGETFQDTSSEAVKLITQTEQQLQRELAGAEQTYCRFREQAPILSMSRSDQKTANPHEERLREIDIALTQNRLRQSEVRTRLEVVREALKSGATKQIDDLQRLALIGQEEMQSHFAHARGNARGRQHFRSIPVEATAARGGRRSRTPRSARPHAPRAGNAGGLRRGPPRSPKDPQANRDRQGVSFEEEPSRREKEV